MDKYFQKEIEANRMLGPFKSNPLSRPLAISPLNTVPKRDSDKRRVIADLSFPPCTSVNAGIDKNVYLDQEVSLSYPSVDTLASHLIHWGPSALMFKRDLAHAYRQFMLDPADISFVGYSWRDNIFIDLALVMGSRSATHICQRITFHCH